PRGAALVDGEGTIAPDGRADVSARVTADDLRRFGDAAGRVTATVRLTSTAAAEHIVFDINRQTMRVGETTAARVTVHGEGDVGQGGGGGAAWGKVTLTADAVQSGGFDLGELRITAGGDRQRFTVEASTTAPHTATRLEAVGLPKWKGNRPVAVSGTLKLLALEGHGQRWTLAQ